MRYHLWSKLLRSALPASLSNADGVEEKQACCMHKRADVLSYLQSQIPLLARR